VVGVTDGRFSMHPAHHQRLTGRYMASRRDQLQSYQFLVQRVVSALVLRETDPAQAPFRRALGTAFAGVMVAGLALAAVGIYGVIKPGGKKTWKDGAAVIVEKETGTRYVYRAGKLYPVVNYASALLILGAHAETVSVSSNSLVGTPRGPRLGIPDAPDALPDKSRLLGTPWSLCSQPQRDSTGRLVTTTVLVVGREPSRGRRLDDRAVLVKDDKSDALFLVWRNHRYEITDTDTVLGALSLGQAPRVSVGGAWLNALPAGEALSPLEVSDRGEESTALAGARVGQVFVVRNQGGEEEFYLVRDDKLEPITEVQADLLLTAEATREAYPGESPDAKELTTADARSAPKADPPATGPEQPPARRPQLADVTDGSTAVCASFDGPKAAAEILIDATADGAVEAIATGQQTTAGTALADRIKVEPGWGAVVEAMQSPDATSGTFYVVTDLGRRYALASPDILELLGYPPDKVTRLPASLVARIPEGPSLDPAAAARPVAEG
jgi:type VII secretion protein EccB